MTDVWNGLWETSENGNATMTRMGYCVTVFEQNHGWTYSIADIETDEVDFYDGHESETEARLAAMDHLLELVEA